MIRNGTSRVRIGVATAVGIAAVLSGVPAAAADTASDGLWYFDVLNVQDAHDAGFTGDGVTVAVLDSSIYPDIATLRGTDLRVQESPECYLEGAPLPVESDDVGLAYHGTNVVSMIIGTGAGDDGQVGLKGVAPEATVLYYRVGDSEDLTCEDADGVEVHRVGEAINDAVTAGADIISMSITFGFDQSVYDAVLRALQQGVIIVSAISNFTEAADFGHWSSMINGAVNVQAIDSTGTIPTHSDPDGVEVPNADASTDVAAPGVDILVQGSPAEGWSRQGLASGTSLATPIVAGFLAVASQKYPEATSNRLIQSLIHNTGVEDHELTFDENHEIGYGIVSLTHLLRVDPAQYPDTNPLLTEDGDPPQWAVIEDPEVPVGSTPDHAEPASGSLILWLVVGGAGFVVLVAIVVTIVVLARRRARSRGN